MCTARFLVSADNSLYLWQKQEAAEDPEPPASAEEYMYAVKWIMAKELEEGQEWYLVRWQGYGAAHDSWEPAPNLAQSATDLVAAYEARAAELVHTCEQSLASRPCTYLLTD